MKANEISRQLPRVLQKRFESLGSFVRAVIDDELSRLNRGAATKHSLSTERIERIQLVALVYGLDTFLRAGTYAAKSAAHIFQSFDMTGFNVGAELFNVDNAATNRGLKLAVQLKQSLEGTPYARMITDARSMTKLIKALIREAVRE